MWAGPPLRAPTQACLLGLPVLLRGTSIHSFGPKIPGTDGIHHLHGGSCQASIAVSSTLVPYPFQPPNGPSDETTESLPRTQCPASMVHSNVSIGHPLRPGVQLTSQAGAPFAQVFTSTAGWAPSDKDRHINKLELFAMFDALKSFLPLLHGNTVLVATDNMPAMHYINKQGGTHSLHRPMGMVSHPTHLPASNPSPRQPKRLSQHPQCKPTNGNSITLFFSPS